MDVFKNKFKQNYENTKWVSKNGPTATTRTRLPRLDCQERPWIQLSALSWSRPSVLRDLSFNHFFHRPGLSCRDKSRSDSQKPPRTRPSALPRTSWSAPLRPKPLVSKHVFFFFLKRDNYILVPSSLMKLQKLPSILENTKNTFLVCVNYILVP